MGWSVRRFGALWVTCAGRWEHFHQTLKLQYRASSKRSKEYAQEMVRKLRSQRMLALANLVLQESMQIQFARRYNQPDVSESRLMGTAVIVNMNLTASEFCDSAIFQSVSHAEVNLTHVYMLVLTFIICVDLQFKSHLVQYINGV